ncbi:hypothetical protein BCR39DRAFT_559113 [Naematelia encephala]|uniref:RRM domain-containing protein n=1 Tax=Naematelia encephala TaxID=71784 RepID=A0A1Y2B4A3_9TREE|nr:hypothetical protein BCR39DRAFT_559113 [Naematelia encephala]
MNGHAAQHAHSASSPPLPNFHALSISPAPYPQQHDYRYTGVFGPPVPGAPTQGWASPGKRGSRSGIPTNWYDPSSRESPNQFEPYRRDGNSPPALSPPSSTTSGPTSAATNPYHSYIPPVYDPSSFAPMAVTPSPPPPMNFGMNSTSSVPNLAGYNPGGMPAFGSQSLAALNQRNSGVWRYGATIPMPDDDVIPTAIVIKNIPFAVSRETLLGVIESLGAPLPYAFNYHHDSGIFRGLAFANFRAPEEAAAVVAALNGYDVQGRKLRVEYKKVLQPGEKDKIEREKALKRMRSIQFDAKEMPPPLSLPTRTTNGHLAPDNDHSPPHSASSATSDSLPMSLDLNDPQALDIYSRVLVFKEDRMRDDLAFSRNLTPTERRIVHLVAQKLGLTSVTKGEGDVKYVVVTREAVTRPNLTSSSSATISSTYLSPYSTTPSDLSPLLRIKKSMPDLRGFNGPVVARDPTRSLTPQRSSGNLRESREYVSMGAAGGRRANGFGSGNFNGMFGSPIDAPPVPPLPSGLALHGNRSNVSQNGSASSPPEQDVGGSTSAPLRNPRGPAGESRGFQSGGGLRNSASAVLRGAIARRVSEEEEEEEEGIRTRESLEI